MRKGIHPEQFRPVVFKDVGTEDTFLIKSTVETKDTIVWNDGKEYPLYKLEISHKSHPFFTGKMKFVDTAGRIEKFEKRYEKFNKKKKTSDKEDKTPETSPSDSTKDASPDKTSDTAEQPKDSGEDVKAAIEGNDSDTPATPDGKSEHERESEGTDSSQGEGTPEEKSESESEAADSSQGKDAPAEKSESESENKSEEGDGSEGKDEASS